jgi:hypothetical protein
MPIIPPLRKLRPAWATETLSLKKKGNQYPINGHVWNSEIIILTRWKN